MALFHHGVRIIEVNEGARPAKMISTAIIGAIATADDADAAFFPLNKPVLITNLQAALGKAGSTGTLRKTLQGIADQCSPFVVVVRVDEGASDAETTSNVIGGTVNGVFTGMQALLAAEMTLGVRPRILGAPGLDTQPVAAALAVLAKKLRGMAYVSAGASANKEDAVAYGGDFGDRELMVIWPDALAWDTVTNASTTAYATARALGVRARADQEMGWNKTISNIEINGITGTSRDVYFDLRNEATDANYLNSNNVTTIVRNNGFRFWGSRTCSAEPLFAFESAVRTGQILGDVVADASAFAIGKPMSPHLVKDIVETGNARIRALVGQGYMLGGSMWYDEEPNTSAQLAGGKVILDFDYTPTPPLEDLTLRQRITDRYLLDFGSQVNG